MGLTNEDSLWENKAKIKLTTKEFKSLSIIAVDFDGTLHKGKLPNIGKPRKKIIQWIKDKQKNGSKIILHTCREKHLLRNAIEWCTDQGLMFDKVNENLDIFKDAITGKRKIIANIYLDDSSLHPDVIEQIY